MCLGIPGEIVEIHDDKGLRVGRVRFAGITREVCLQYVPEATPGEFVVVHVGFAISKIDRGRSGARLPGARRFGPDVGI